MKPLQTFAAGAATGLVTVIAFVLAVATTASPPAPKALAQQLRFVSSPLTSVAEGRPAKFWRAVNPGYARISGWISSVGAAAALADLSGAGKPADICLVDPRYDTVTVSPAPGTGARFAPFALEAPLNGYKQGTTAPMGCLVGDFDEDGLTDVLVYFWGRTPVIFKRVVGGPPAATSFRPIELVPGHQIWFTNAALQADFRGVGHLDLLFGNYFPDDSAVLDPNATNHPSMQRSMSRGYNGGGLHLFLWRGASAAGPAYTDASIVLPHEDVLDWLGRPHPRRGWTLALATADLKGDLRPSIYVANDFGINQLLLNTTSKPGLPSFEIVKGERDLFTPRSKVLGDGSFKGMGADVASITGDGRPTIAVSNISAPFALIESHFLFVQRQDAKWSPGHAPFDDESFQRGVWLSNWAWDIKFADLTNSGCQGLVQAIGFLKGRVNRWPQLQELAMTNDSLVSNPASWPQFKPTDDLSGRDHDRVYLQDCSTKARDPGRFYDVSSSLDLGGQFDAADGQPGTVSRAVAMGDVYGDGRLSLVIARQWMPSVFLRNVSPAGRAIVLNLRTAGYLAGDRPLIGAEARLTLPNGRVVADVVDGGSGHGGKRAPEIHLGLGPVSADQSFDVALSWRDSAGVHREIRRLTAGRYTILLGAKPAPATADAEGGNASG
jgi:hypothetical protein